MEKRRAFTLIELLVVIAIIALLTSVLVPAVDRTKRLAKTIMCRANLHQWGITWQVFISDNEGKFMTGYEYNELMDEPSGFGGEARIDDEDHSWPLILLPYYHNEKLLCCPEAKVPPPFGEGGREPTERRVVSIYSTWSLWVKYPTDFMYGSYGINSWTYNRGDHDGMARWRRVPAKRAHNVPLMLDCYWCEGYPSYYDEPPADRIWGYFADSSNFMRRFCIDRHNGANNALLCDLSARRVGLKQLWDLEWHPYWNPQNRPGPVWPEWMEDM